MPKQGLNVTNVRAVFQKVGGKSVAQVVDRNIFLDLGMAEGFVKNALSGTDCKRVFWVLAGEKPGFNIKKIAVFNYKFGGNFGKNCVAIFSALALLYVNYFAGKIYVLFF